MSDEKDWVAVTDLLPARAERFPDRVAMNVNGTGGITYWEWQRRVNRTANGPLRAGVRRGDAIALLFGGMDWSTTPSPASPSSVRCLRGSPA
ncbi:hypothetical protein ACIQ8G_08175 [Streptomyces sp. NPDC094154]|uniref:hypothetical protein n=1 Tax=unclassified Streptomyces TaxID=2593676 RepID=UPI002DD9C108|nr:hypothetical protein [Streptomyces sp. NBC_01788]WSB30222.1 long-chain fatty acid--CoA ligase [Streptomyces sp. NBC_01788]